MPGRPPGVGIGSLLGTSSAMEKVRRFARTAAGVNVPVLILGETGTGKTHLGRVIHWGSLRARGPFVSVNCAGIPDTLFESEFFGHRKGAFTGAGEGRRGILEQAQGGSLFLDEVGELTVGQQAKLLVALEEGEVRRLGGEGTTKVDVRILAATSRDLGRELRNGRFRKELFYRLAVLTCHLPPLRSRREDIPHLAQELLGAHQRRHGHAATPLPPGAQSFLQCQDWPGNVRELAHVLEAALVLCGGKVLEVEDLEAARAMADHGSVVPEDEEREGASMVAGSRMDGGGAERPEMGRPEPAPSSRYSFPGAPEEEKALIGTVLERARGNKSRAARELGMARNTLRQKLLKYGLG